MQLVKWALIIVGVIFVLSWINDGTSEPPANNTVTAQTKLSSSRPDKRKLYTDDLKFALAQVSEFKPSDHTSDAATIGLAFALFSMWAQIADKAPSNIDDEAVELRKQLLTTLSAKQKQAFPILRDAYGPAMRKLLWEADGKARTIGSGYRTVEFISHSFAANRNIKAFHEEIRQTLLQMRFTRAQYKWVDANVEYTYYTMTPPSDGEVVVWSGSSFRHVK